MGQFVLMAKDDGPTQHVFMLFVMAETGLEDDTALLVCTKIDEEPVVDYRQTTIPDFKFVLNKSKIIL